LSPDARVGLDINKFFAFVSAVKVEAIVGLIIAVGERDQVGLVAHAESDSYVLRGFEYLAYLVCVGNFSVLSSNVKRHAFIIKPQTDISFSGLASQYMVSV
jgi:hypothetical protein